MHFLSLFLLLGLPELSAAEPAKAKPETTFAQINEVLGVELLMDDNLWDDDAAALAERLKWSLESQTSVDASYRSYPEASATLLGCRPYSCALYADKSAPTSISVIFANKGDAVTYTLAKGKPDKEALAAHDSQVKEFKKAISEDKKILAAALTKLFGPSIKEKMGQGRQTSEMAYRWDWKEHAFLLSAPRDEYVALRIMSVATADLGGKSRISDAELHARSKTRIDRRANGDVILKDIPMVNQGPKGYCAPASWERVMRYMGVPADMYVLAMAGNSGAGGGTSLSALAAGARESVLASGRKIETMSFKIEPVVVAKYIDKGLPLVWAMFSTKEYNKVANDRLRARSEMTDPKVWKKELAGNKEKWGRPDTTTAHACLIIGYNKETGEVAVSDSWGPQFEERWVTAAEAQAVSQGLFQVITY